MLYCGQRKGTLGVSFHSRKSSRLSQGLGCGPGSVSLEWGKVGINGIEDVKRRVLNGNTYKNNCCVYLLLCWETT